VHARRRLLKSAWAPTDYVTMKGKADPALPLLLVIALTSLAVAGCGGESSGSHTPAASKRAGERVRSYTRAEVASAFAAEGLPLTAPFPRQGKAIVLVPQDSRLIGRVSVIVYPPMPATQGIRVQAGQRVVGVKNVVIAFAPKGRPASVVRAAIVRLKHM
jgi:hypothetical protein